MSLKTGKFSRGRHSFNLLLKLLILSILMVSCGGIVPAPKQKPKVDSTIPADGATEIDKKIRVITATFNKDMDGASLKGSFLLKEKITEKSVSGIVKVGGESATFTPDFPLGALTSYIATITSGAKDLSGDSISQDFIWEFTLSDVTDSTAPVVDTVKPDGKTLVSVKTSKTKISVTFSKAINRDTVKGNINISLSGGAKLKVDSGVWSNGGKTVTFDLRDQLKFSKNYDIEVLGGAGKGQIQDTLGIDLEPDTFISTFTTKAETDND